MFIRRRSLIQIGVGASLAPAAMRMALAQSFPLSRLVVGFPPGGTTDLVTRRVADKMHPTYASTVIVENRVGAGGQIAVSSIKTAPKDGSVLLMSPMAMLCVYPATYKSLPYDPVNDVVPICTAVTFSNGLAVGAAVPESVKSLKDFLAWCKENPSKASFGSGSTGSPLHLTGALLGRAGGVELTHVGYRGSSGILNDVAGGILPACVSPVGDMLAFQKAGKLRVLATTGATRSRFLPDVPTFAESGFGELTHEDWYGFFAPRGTPDRQIQQANSSIAQALASGDVIESLHTFGLEAQPSSPEELAERANADRARWAAHVKEVGFSANA